MKLMYKKLKLIVMFLSLTVLLQGCSEDELDDNREYITTCYRFVEMDSDTPVVGMPVLIHYGYSNVLSKQGVTDENGEWCFQHWNDNGPFATPYTYVLKQAFYNFPNSLPLNGTTNTIELIPRSTIDFHIVNKEPAHSSDRLDVYVTFRVSEIYSLGYSKPFEGASINTHYLCNAIKGTNKIEWKVYSDGVLQNTYTDEVIIENFHETVDYTIEY